MSSSTSPKSIQAENSRQTAGGPSNRDKHGRLQQCRTFIDKYKNLPDDFLRIPASYYGPVVPHNELSAMPPGAINVGQLVDMIDISVVEAQLVKNYGLLRMDLYCKIRVGHMICETQTCPNGAKNPKWDGAFQFRLTPGIDSFHLEIYDEKQFSLDEKIASLHSTIPPEIFQGITVERWYPLSGRLGVDKEGSILLVISHKRVPKTSPAYARTFTGQSVPVYLPNQPITVGGGPQMLPVDPRVQVPVYVQAPPNPEEQQTNQPPHQAVSQASEEDINQLSEMFPSIDKSVIKVVLENNNHDKEAAIGALLAMA